MATLSPPRMSITTADLVVALLVELPTSGCNNCEGRLSTQ
jgi:hypothetical protein